MRLAVHAGPCRFAGSPRDAGGETIRRVEMLESMYTEPDSLTVSQVVYTDLGGKLEQCFAPGRGRREQHAVPLLAVLEQGMTVIVFSKNPNSSRMKFPRRPRTGPQVEVHPVSRLRKLLPSLEQGQLVYLDMAGLGEVDRRRLLAALAKRPGIFFAVIDPLAKVSDVASLFHAGAVDYMGREFRRTGLTARRLDRVMAFARASHGQPTALAAGEAPAGPPEPQPAEKRPGRDGWAGVVAGREHPFAFLFVEVDNIEAIKRRCGADNLSRGHGNLPRVHRAHGDAARRQAVDMGRVRGAGPLPPALPPR